MVYKMLIMNIDGTLLQDSGKISKFTREAVEYALGKGITVTIATSRNFPSAKRIAKALKINTFIVSHQGAYIGTDLNKPIYVNRINEQVTSEIIALLESFSCKIKLVHEKFSIGNKIELPDQMLAKVMFQTSNRFTYPEHYVDSISDTLFDRPVSPPKIEVSFQKKSDLEDAKKAMKEMFDEVDCINTEVLKLDIIPNGVSKLKGVSYVCEKLGIHREEVVSIGSGFDDMPLMQWAGLGVAMGNAPALMRETADWLTRTNNDDGVAYMVKEHFRRQYRLEFLKKINVIK